MKFMLVCGGSAGHINPAIATADALRKLLPGCEILFIGAGRSMEKKLVPQAGYELSNIDMLGLSRGFTPKKLKHNSVAAIKLATASRRAEKLIREYMPSVVIGTGGYICYPVLKAAAKAKVPTALHESNAVPGLTAKVLAPIVDKIFTSFEESAALYKDPSKVNVMATPVRANFMRYTRERARHDLAIGGDMPVVVSFWGSLGASGMNGYMADFIRRNIESESFRHIHAAGTPEAAEKIKAEIGKELPAFI
ncbi:MAG: UDP-N-acetylglucosamine--N-acetylmuramyl-(pentapeptide) pyrophosphoryl-undecaprenol N-acetylglucosamine transferase, partial [Clostridiales bacterium]|nr:UDP-N-acetylglucosamine--N-acetylmuramyl-(pentapeptide) pyrophosphoryl-undecaprenol N-acetylglucosamine transferase [Clostridiales bacterium]